MTSPDQQREPFYLSDSGNTDMPKIARASRETYSPVSSLFCIGTISLQKLLDGTLSRQIEIVKNLKYYLSTTLVAANMRLNRRPSSTPFLSGDTFRSLADHVYEKENLNFDIAKLRLNDIIFCQSDQIKDLNEKVLDVLEFDVVLLLGNSDQNFNREIASSLNLDKVKKVFAQNLVDEIEKFEVLPIGLENAWRLDNGKPITFKLQRLFRYSKIFKVMWTFSPTNIDERVEALNALSKSDIAKKLPRISKFKHRVALSKYAFVASPPGNGLDCHRTWEAMYLRCIPIVKRSFMTEQYERQGLPIWVVDSYDELSEHNEESLRAKYNELKPRLNSELLWFKHWRELIKPN